MSEIMWDYEKFCDLESKETSYHWGHLCDRKDPYIDYVTIYHCNPEYFPGTQSTSGRWITSQMKLELWTYLRRTYRLEEGNLNRIIEWRFDPKHKAEMPMEPPWKYEITEEMQAIQDRINHFDEVIEGDKVYYKARVWILWNVSSNMNKSGEDKNE